jgi:hypothetical protein
LKRILEYRYDSWTKSCGCCSDSMSTYRMWEDGFLVVDDEYCELIENEDQLREVFKEQEPFEISEDTKYF